VEKRDFWIGFTWGAAAAIGGALVAGRFRRGGASRILRLEKSMQIARPPAEVFDVWSDFEELAKYTDALESVRSAGHRSHWRANVRGVPVQWDAELTQLIPNQAIGWKSVSGPKHSGRVTFSPLANDTLVHVQMNYMPPARILRRALSPFGGDIEGYIEQGLRDVKAGLEKKPVQRQPVSPEQERQHQDALGRATGTYGPGPELIAEQQNPKFGAPSTPVEYTAPPDAKR
jgi:uncharacterized membrane protein